LRLRIPAWRAVAGPSLRPAAPGPPHPATPGPDPPGRTGPRPTWPHLAPPHPAAPGPTHPAAPGPDPLGRTWPQPTRPLGFGRNYHFLQAQSVILSVKIQAIRPVRRHLAHGIYHKTKTEQAQNLYEHDRNGGKGRFPPLFIKKYHFGSHELVIKTVKTTATRVKRSPVISNSTAENPRTDGWCT
jgi:hypothetical protein